MPPEQESDQQPTQPAHEREVSDVLTLVDLFDQLDRAAFHRALNDRDRKIPPDVKR